MNEEIRLEDDGVNPISYIKSYFSHLTDREISVLIGSIFLLKEVKYETLQHVLDKERLEIEEKIGRLMQTDLIQGEFTEDKFVLEKLNYPIKKQRPNLILDDRVMLAYLKARIKVSLTEIQKAFDLNYESTIYTLSGFVSRGLITPKKLEDDFYEITVHYSMPDKTPGQITTLEKQIVGLAMLRSEIELDELVLELDEPEFKIYSSLVNLILADLITVNFEFIPSYFGGGKIMMEIERFKIDFPQRSIQTMEEKERMILGLAGLRGKLSLAEAAKILNIDDRAVLKIVAEMMATNQFSFGLNKNNELSVQQQISFDVNRSVEVLSSISLFNYRILIGILKTQKEISVSDIASKMRETELDILKGIIDLYLEGLIVGQLTSSYKFILTAVRRDTSQNITLKDWEKILLGALISEKVLSWPKIAALLEVDRKTASDRAFEFLSKGFSNTRAQDTVLIMEETPSLPPLAQLSELSKEETEMLGIVGSSDRVSKSDLERIFDYSSISIFRMVYFLTGSGFLNITRKKSTFIVNSSNLEEPIESINSLPNKYKDIIKFIQNQPSDEFKIGNMANHINRHMSRCFKDLGYVLAHGYYKAKIDGSSIIITSSLQTTAEKSICMSCSLEIPQASATCPECNTEIPKCSVCKGKLFANEQIVSCPHCKHMSHSAHLREWLKIKGECPICKNRLTERQLLIHQVSLE